MSKIFVTHQPKKSWLKKYISYYYFHQNTISGDENRFIYYSNVENALTIYKNSLVDFSNEKLSTTYPCEGQYFFLYSGIIKDYFLVNLIAPYDKIGIVFKPLGLQYFIKDSVDFILKLTEKKRSEYFQNLLKTDLDRLFDENIEKRVKGLDQLFSELFHAFEDDKFIQIMDEVIDGLDEININQLSQKFGLSTKTLQRKFQKNFAVTPKQYLKVVKFRRAFNHYMQENKAINFTDLSYFYHYYDQSEYIHHFKSITGTSPKKLFRNIEKLSEEDIYWNFKV
ncbi:helix-turn-helix domain-containing protein [Empedobacter brevis]|uniref:helix-turn-helix domain-containing protein n=1 Tax=Empedobacter brevis TaxID=247 RepID=UPI0023F40D20|nr:helix-turn-helix domain-containing protein [Empedobacter brevis]